MQKFSLLILLFLITACSKEIDVQYELKTRNDGKFYAGMSKVDIMPVLFNEDGSCPPGRFCFERHINLGPEDGCPNNEDNYFEGELNNPEGKGCKEPFIDSNGNGGFDALWLGGYNIARAATDYDRDVPIYAKVIVMAHNNEYVLLINLPFVGFPTLQLASLREKISAFSGGTISEQRIIPMVQHNHGVPDTQGIWGPDLVKNYGLIWFGEMIVDEVFSAFEELFDRIEFPLPSLNYRNLDYWYWVEDKVIEAVKTAIDDVKPAKVKLGIKETPHRETGCQLIPFEGEVKIDCDNDGVYNEGEDSGIYAGGDLNYVRRYGVGVEGEDCLQKGYNIPFRFLVEDLRLPFALDYNVYTMQFLSEDEGDIIGTFIIWGHHIEEADSENTMITGDVAEYACEFVERKLGGGVCVFQIGPEGGLTSTNSDAIPYVDEEGYYYDCKGNRHEGSNLADDFIKYLDDEGELKFEVRNYFDAISAGRNVAKTALASLEEESTVYDVEGFNSRYLYSFLPMDNPYFYLGGRIELMTGMSLLLRKDLKIDSAHKIKDLVFRSELSPDNDSCGGAVCIRALYNLISINLEDNENKMKRVGIATVPGELFPEYLVGREESSYYFQNAKNEMGDVSKDPAFPSDILSPDINPQRYEEVKGLKEVAFEADFDEFFIMAQANASFGYMMPRSDYLPVFEGFFDMLEDVLPVLDDIMIKNGGIYRIFNLTENEKYLRFSDVIEDTLDRYTIYIRNYSPPSGKNVDVMSHPNAYEENVSMGPRTGDIVYNAVYGLINKGSYEGKIEVPSDPNTDPEVLSLDKTK